MSVVTNTEYLQYPFRTSFAQDIFYHKYNEDRRFENWHHLCEVLVDEVCGTDHGTKPALMSAGDRAQLTQYMAQMKFIPGGRYLYYAGRPAKFYNNCFLLRGEEDTREEWGRLLRNASDALMSGGGIGVDYSIFRPKGAPLGRTGGTASGPLPLINSVNEVGRNVMQGGSRRSAIYASLNWQHPDIPDFLRAKNWRDIVIHGGRHPFTVWDAKLANFNFPAPLDMTNISINYDDHFLTPGTSAPIGDLNIFVENVRQALSTGEPGFSFNFGNKGRETLRNPCCEVTSEDDSDVCNLGSINLSQITSLADFTNIVELATAFLICGTVRAALPYPKNYVVREKNRRIGLGLMGIHEWLLRRGCRYEVTDELKSWLHVYEDMTDAAAVAFSGRHSISVPIGRRAIAPTGSIGILAATTTGVEPLFATAFKRRYLSGGSTWKHQFVVDATAEHLIREYSVKPEEIETALSLASTPERRIAFQADVQDYVDMAISSTINLPAWGSDLNNEDKVQGFAETLAAYAPRLRGFTCYPDGARGGQPLTAVDFEEAHAKRGMVFDEIDICDLSGRGGSCGS